MNLRFKIIDSNSSYVISLPYLTNWFNDSWSVASSYSFPICSQISLSVSFLIELVSSTNILYKLAKASFEFLSKSLEFISSIKSKKVIPPFLSASVVSKSEKTWNNIGFFWSYPQFMRVSFISLISAFPVWSTSNKSNAFLITSNSCLDNPFSIFFNCWHFNIFEIFLFFNYIIILIYYYKQIF